MWLVRGILGRRSGGEGGCGHLGGVGVGRRGPGGQAGHRAVLAPPLLHRGLELQVHPPEVALPPSTHHLMLRLLLLLLSSLASPPPSSPRCRRNLGLEVAGGLGAVPGSWAATWPGAGRASARSC